MRRMLLAAAVAALVLPANAGAGGWATVGVAPLPGGGLGAGDRWTATLTVLQHGVTPLDGVQPRLIVRNTVTGASQAFDARPAGEPGKYLVDVRFPAEGRWVYSVDDGIGGRHSFAPVSVGEPGGSPFPWLPVALGALLAAALAAAGIALRRRRPVAGATPLPG